MDQDINLHNIECNKTRGWKLFLSFFLSTVFQTGVEIGNFTLLKFGLQEHKSLDTTI
jgi:hypothetical protein